VPREPAPTAESLADLCLTHLAQDAELLAEFMGIAGYSPAGLRAAIRSPQLQHGLIDYFAQNEPLLLAFCDSNALKPEQFMRVWAKLNPSG
jgi:hypothetical protein